MISPILLKDLDPIHEPKTSDIYGESNMDQTVNIMQIFHFTAKYSIICVDDSFLDSGIREFSVRVGSDGCSECFLKIFIYDPEVESDSLEFLFHQSFIGLYLWKDQELKIVKEVWYRPTKL